MKKQIMTIAAIAMGAIAFTTLSTTANAGVMSPGLINTAEFTNESVEVTKVGGGHRRGHRWGGHRGHRWGGHRGHRWGARHGYNYGYNNGWKRYKKCRRLQRQGYRIRCNRPL